MISSKRREEAIGNRVLKLPSESKLVSQTGSRELDARSQEAEDRFHFYSSRIFATLGPLMFQPPLGLFQAGTSGPR